MKELLLHLLTPRTSNNHRAKALHLSAITTYITILLVFQIALTVVSHAHPEVLGYASNISVTDLLSDTNARRAAAGAPPLSLNSSLSNAAAGKAADMFGSQYWAHVSPSGKTPWDFISGAGYSYLFAGENLARDFGDSQGVVDAWMNSPSHRENLLNSKFKEVGFAVVNGKLNGNETTLVVQMFGAQAGGQATVAAPQAPAPAPSPVITFLPTPAATLAATPAPVTPVPTPSGAILNLQKPEPPARFDILGATKNASSGLIAFLMSVLVVDSVVAYRRRVVRLTGHNFAHLILLLAVLTALNILGRGIIL